MLNDNDIRKLADGLLFKLNDREVKAISEEFEKLDKMLGLFDVIDTEGTEEMICPTEEETVYLRDDVPCGVLNKEEVLANAAETESGMIVIPKVVR
ncbi:MAG: aspartyl/glutamyl-tRNA amidotransferase subunit C [Erysipelotrichaceae bacterium]|nr:aspartyl/glutamyl-tRNA amidotransferase subunit C [Erysipelotrichaceae bacterium]